VLARIAAYVRQHHLALFALFIALGGTAWALEANSVESKHIVNDTVKSRDVRDDNLTGKDFKAGSWQSIQPANADCVANTLRFCNTWENVGGDYSTAEVYMDPVTKMVHLKGLVRCADECQANTLFHLPPELRPPEIEAFPALANGSLGQVNVAGQVSLVSGAGTDAVGLTGIQWATTGTP
jgi:hypothetical protein